MHKKSILIIFGLSLLLIAPKCGNQCYEIINGRPILIPCPPDPSPSPIPTETPTPEPSITPTPTPTETPTPEPTITPTPSPEDCSKYKATTTGWNPLTCVLNNKQVCGTPTSIPCGCNGEGCTFNVKVGTSCAADSTPRYNGEVACWKTGNIERCEYPPGSSCGDITTWNHDSGVIVNPEPDGYGAKIKFPLTGTFRITACRKGTNLCTIKKAKVN